MGGDLLRGGGGAYLGVKGSGLRGRRFDAILKRAFTGGGRFASLGPSQNVLEGGNEINGQDGTPWLSQYVTIYWPVVGEKKSRVLTKSPFQCTYGPATLKSFANEPTVCMWAYGGSLGNPITIWISNFPYPVYTFQFYGRRHGCHKSGDVSRLCGMATFRRTLARDNTTI